MDYTIPIGVIGISHKTASVEIREKVALVESELETVVKGLLSSFDIDGCMAISTCNRTEVYVSGEDFANQLDGIRTWLDDYKSCRYFTNDQQTYTLTGSDAVRHFYLVISGLDSQVLGEPQITGQVKESYNHARQLNATGTVLNKLFTFGLQAQKKIRTETFLTDGAVSVSFASVELARKIFNKLHDKQVLLIGAGETAELAATHFVEKGIKRIHIANRTPEKARQLATRFHGQALGLDELESSLPQVDIVISATSGTEYVLTKQMMNPICKARRHRPIFLIDLAIPRDIEPATDELNDVYLYNLDDLNDVVQSNIEKRKHEIPKSMKIVDDYVEIFEKWISTHSVGFTINKLKRYFDGVRLQELDRLGTRLPRDGYEDIDYLTQSIINKIMHQHIKLLKKSAADPDRYQQHVDFVNSLYDLDGD
jgi:glutamyl-tRNA reductase